MSKAYSAPLARPVARSARQLQQGDFIARVNGSGSFPEDAYGWGKVLGVRDVSEKYPEYPEVLYVDSETPHVNGETVTPDRLSYWVWTDERSPWSSAGRAGMERYNYDV